MQPQLYSGARGKISFTDASGNTSVLGFVTDVSISRNDGLRPAFVIGNIGPKSIEPVSTDVSGSIGRIIPVSTTDGKAMAQTTSIDYGFEVAIANILSSESVTITLEDQETGKTIDIIKYCRFAGRNTSVGSGDLGSERYSFVGILSGGYGGDTNFLADNSTDLNYGKES